MEAKDLIQSIIALAIMTSVIIFISAFATKLVAEHFKNNKRPTTKHVCEPNKELIEIKKSFNYWHNKPDLNERNKRDSIYTDLSRILILGI